MGANLGQGQAGKTRPLSARQLDLIAYSEGGEEPERFGKDLVVLIAPYEVVELYIRQLLS